jgi:hypothetical protein
VKDKIWNIDYEGHLITIRNKISIIPPKTSEVLEVDGVIVKHEKGSFFLMAATIKSNYSFNGVEKDIEVRMAQKVGGVGVGAQVYINNEFVGGDKSINYLDSELALKQYKKGYLRHLLTVGLLKFGLPFAILMAIVNKGDPAFMTAWTFSYHAIGFGGLMSYFSWRTIKKQLD